MQTGGDDLDARVAQGAGDHFGAAVVAVEAGFGYDDAVLVAAGMGFGDPRLSRRPWGCTCP
ncbi:hypothetical protein GCM10010424_65520 [Streptomyces lienomycini]